MKNNKAITLIALIITIIVLLILAGITINMVLGENGLFNKSSEARIKNEKQEALEKINLKIAEVQVESYEKTGRKATLQELADFLCDDDEVKQVTLVKSKSATKNQHIILGDNKTIYTILENYPYEFEIGENLQVAKIDGEELLENLLSLGEMPQTRNGDYEATDIEDFNIEVIEDHTYTIKIRANIENEDIRGFALEVDGEIRVISPDNIITIDTQKDTEYNLKMIAINKHFKFKSSQELKYRTRNSVDITLNNMRSNEQDGVKVSYSTTYSAYTNAYQMFDGSTSTPYTKSYLGALYGRNNPGSNYIKIEFNSKVKFNSYDIKHGQTGDYGIGTISQTILYGSNVDQASSYVEIGRGVTSLNMTNSDLTEYKYYKITINTGSEWTSVSEVNFSVAR